jgi:hypothetical protein
LIMTRLYRESYPTCNLSGRNLSSLGHGDLRMKKYEGAMLISRTDLAHLSLSITHTIQAPLLPCSNSCLLVPKLVRPRAALSTGSCEASTPILGTYTDISRVPFCLLPRPLILRTSLPILTATCTDNANAYALEHAEARQRPAWKPFISRGSTKLEILSGRCRSSTNMLCGTLSQRLLLK